MGRAKQYFTDEEKEIAKMKRMALEINTKVTDGHLADGEIPL